MDVPVPKRASHLTFQRRYWKVQRVGWLLMFGGVAFCISGFAGPKPADLVVRAVVLYLFIWLILRTTGARTIGEITTFDFVLLMLIAESTDNSIIGNDNAVSSTLIVIVTFAVMELAFTFLKGRSESFERWSEGVPLVVVEHGKLHKEVSEREKITEDDILAAARQAHGLTELNQIRYAILEKNGRIAIIPK